MTSCRSQVERPSKSGEMMAMSMSLESVAVPLAKDPYRITASRRIRARSRRTKSSSFWLSSASLVTIQKTFLFPRRGLAPLPQYTRRRDTGSLPHGPRVWLGAFSVRPSVQYWRDRRALLDHGSLAIFFPDPSSQPSRVSRRTVGRNRPCLAIVHPSRGCQHPGYRGRLPLATPRRLLASPHLIPSALGWSNA